MTSKGWIRLGLVLVSIAAVAALAAVVLASIPGPKGVGVVLGLLIIGGLLGPLLFWRDDGAKYLVDRPVDAHYDEIPGWTAGDAREVRRWSSLIGGGAMREVHHVLRADDFDDSGPEHLFHLQLLATVEKQAVPRRGYTVCAGHANTASVLAAGVIVQPKAIGRVGNRLGTAPARGPYSGGDFRWLKEASFESIDFDRRYEAFVPTKATGLVVRQLVTPSILDRLTSSPQPIGFGFLGNSLIAWTEGYAWERDSLEALVAAFTSVQREIEKTTPVAATSARTG